MFHPDTLNFQLEQSTEKKDAAKKVISTNLMELSIHKAWTLFCANLVSCLIMVQVAKVVSLKKDSPRGLKLATRLNEHFKGICSNEVESKGAQNSKKRKRRPKGYQNHLENRLKALNFVRRMEGSLHTVVLLMQKDRQEKLERNTKVLDSVIDTIYTLQSVSWILAEFCYNRSPQGPYTGTCTILQETINGFLCPLIVFRKM